MRKKTALFAAVTAILTAGLFTFLPSLRGQRAIPQPFVPEHVDGDPYSSLGDRHTVEVADPLLANQISRMGGTLVADYGSFKLLRVDGRLYQQVLSSRKDAISRDEYHRVLMNSRTIDTSAESSDPASSSIDLMRLVQFEGPITPEWHDALLRTRVRIVTYIPNNAYLVLGDPAALRAASALEGVAWSGQYGETLKLDPEMERRDRVRQLAGQRAIKDPDPKRAAARASANQDLTVIQLVQLASNAATLQLVDRLKTGNIVSLDTALGYVNIVVPLPLAAAKQIAAQPDVVSIQPYSLPTKMDEAQNVIISGLLSGNLPVSGTNYLTYLASKGITQAQFDASGFLVDVTDSGVDNGTASPNHPALYVGGDFANPSRVMYNRLEGTAHSGSTLQGCDGHGNINTHIVGGFVPDTVTGIIHRNGGGTGFRFGLGVCPFVKMGSSVVFDPGDFTSPNFENMLSRQYNSGTRVNSNSWAGTGNGGYSPTSQRYDALVRDAQPAGSAFGTSGNQEMVILFVAGNDGPGSRTIAAPGTGKNVITVGNAENVQAFGSFDGCAVGDTGADSANDMHSGSSRGPCSDGRHKPDIVAPGTHVTGGVFQAAKINPPFSGNGAAGACFDGEGVCGGVGINFFPTTFPQQQFYTASTGTSHSTPAAAGAAALIRQAFINHGMSPATPAMTKAALMNSARYLTGTGANDTLWSNNQGMGEVNLDGFFDTFVTPTIFKDQVPAEILTATGQQKVYSGNIADTGRPFRVTLAWTDPPGPTSGNAFVNNLDLEVSVGGNNYKGNVFANAFSATGGLADDRNNVENVFIPAGVSGPFSVTIKGTNIAGDGVPNVGGPLDQDYALIVYNAVEVVQPNIVATGIAINGESCTVNNGVFDPGETVSVGLTLQNNGSLGSSNVTASLQASANVLNASGPQSFGAMAPGATATRSFTFTINPALACGANLSMTWDINPGTGPIVAASFSRNLGVQNSVFGENFDAVVAPALPAGWIAANATGPGPLWVTSTFLPNTAPNTAFVNDPDSVSDKRLDTPAFLVNSGSAQVSFNNNYDLESSFDGGVLEISIGGGAFTDILAAGGSFASNGYNGTISTSFMNPIGGRQAWTGSSGGYKTSVVNLPPSASGQMVKLRFRMGSDDDFAGTGWRIDGINVLGGFACCAPTAPDLTVTKSHTGTFIQGQTGVYTITVRNSGNQPTAGTVTATDTVPTGLTATAIAGTGWTCAQPAGPCTRNDVLTAGSSYPPITLTVTAVNAGNVTNTVTVSGGSEVNNGNNTATDVTSVVVPGTIFSENFDSVTAPALPAGWVATNASGPALLWVTSTTTPDTAPNSAFVDDPSVISDKRLESPAFLVTASNAQLTFRHTFSFEAGAVTGFDGGVLELAMGAGPFVDILSAGGSFGSGGYNGTISSSFQNPLAGRQAWIKSISGYQTVVVNMPPAANGQVVKLRFRMGSDTTGSSTGWRIDTLRVTVPQGPDLNIVKTHTGNLRPGQVGATYTIRAGNVGTLPTVGTVTVTDAVPIGLNATAISGAGWNCAQPSGPCTRSEALAPGATYPPITLTVTVLGAVLDSVTNTATVSGGGDLIAGNNTASDPTAVGPSISSISPNPITASAPNQTVFINGRGFDNTPGIRVHLVSGGVPIDLIPAFLSATQLSISLNVGTNPANWTAQVINADGRRSNVLSFIVEVPHTTSFALPQFVFGGNTWYTAIYLANPTNAVAHVLVDFYGNDGAPLSVPLSGIGSVTTRSIDLSPRSTTILEAPNTGNLAEGWAEAALPTGVTGYAVFRQSIPGRADQEAVVPLTPESSQAADLTYDDIAFTTAVAFLNPSALSATVTIIAVGDDNASAGSTQVVLAPRSKMSAVLKNLPGLSGIAGKRGRALFSVQTGAVSVLGLRFGGEAFTSIPVPHRSASPQTQSLSFALPQLVFGNPWYTALYFSNTTNSILDVPVSFTSNAGTALGVPLVGIGTVDSQTVTLNPGATKILEAPLGATSGEGWAEATLPPGITGYAVFRQTIAGRSDQEAVVPLTSEADQTANLIYDDTQFTTAVAFVNSSDQPTTVTITIFSATGTQIGSTQVVLAARAKLSAVLKNLSGLVAMAGQRGLAVFSVPNGAVSVLGLRFGGEAFTSIPVR